MYEVNFINPLAMILMVIAALSISSYLISLQKAVNSVTRTKNPSQRNYQGNLSSKQESPTPASNPTEVGVNYSNSLIGIKFSDLQVKFDSSPVIAHVSGFVPPGKITALLGPTGW